MHPRRRQSTAMNSAPLRGRPYARSISRTFGEEGRARGYGVLSGNLWEVDSKSVLVSRRESPTHDLRMRTDEEIRQGKGRRILAGILFPTPPVSHIGTRADLSGGGDVQHFYTPTANTVGYLLGICV